MKINNMTYIKSFNDKVDSLFKELDDGNIKFLKNEFANYRDSYTAIDDIGFKLGVDIIAKSESDHNDKYIPTLKFYENNILNKEKDFVELTANGMNINACYETLAKEWIYKIRPCKIENLKLRLEN